MRVLRRLVALTLLLALAGAAPAEGHAALLGTRPAPESRLPRAPAAVALRFGEPVVAGPRALVVADGRALGRARPGTRPRRRSARRGERGGRRRARGPRRRRSGAARGGPHPLRLDVGRRRGRLGRPRGAGRSNAPVAGRGRRATA